MDVRLLINSVLLRYHAMSSYFALNTSTYGSVPSITCLMYHTKRSDVDSSNVLLLVQILSAMYHHLYSYTSYIRTLETGANIWPWLCNYIPYFFMRCNPLVMLSIPVSVVMIQIFAVCADITLFYERKDQPYLWWYNDGVECIKTNHTVSIPAKSILGRYFDRFASTSYVVGKHWGSMTCII